MDGYQAVIPEFVKFFCSLKGICKLCCSIKASHGLFGELTPYIGQFINVCCLIEENTAMMLPVCSYDTYNLGFFREGLRVRSNSYLEKILKLLCTLKKIIGAQGFGPWA